MGYVGQEWFLASHEQGGAVYQERLVEVYVQSKNQCLKNLPQCPGPQGLPPRPMSNLLRSHGIPPQDRAKRHLTQRFPEPDLSNHPHHLVGLVGGHPIYGNQGCMPDKIGRWVDDGVNIRKLRAAELAKGKGLPGEWVAKGQEPELSYSVVTGATSVHIWTVVCDSIAQWVHADKDTTEMGDRSTEDSDTVTTAAETWADEDETDWDYTLPDLSKDGRWYQERVNNLREAIAGRPDQESLWQEGLEALEIHRGNYTEAGPKYLQVLWWEFPPEHQEAVRKGSSMRFLVDPGEELVPNPPLTDEQVKVVGEFVDELESLGIVREADKPLRRVCPIFVVPKPGQPGQWRCIADMKAGGQNPCCSLDPIYLPSSKDILPQLYTGGWTSVADASKYFHNYWTLPEERDLIGLIHPITGRHLWYVGLPMGSVNSPSIACRIGEGILEVLRKENPVYRPETYVENTWRKDLKTGGYDVRIGHGYVGMQRNGRPVAIVFGYVDDFLIHAATKRDCCEATSAFMDLMVRLGLICQPVKTSPPAQVQKYCGFLYDTTNRPTLRIPPNKVSRCRASIKFLQSRPRNGKLSRLSLAIITGVLQLVVEATPQRLGQNHLRTLYEDLHRLEEHMPDSGAEKYYTEAQLTDDSFRALEWWDGLLERNHGFVTSRSQGSGGLVLKWGDGSGTGTGGTTEFYSVGDREIMSPDIELWMGVWGAKAKPRSSNWKEARTVLEALLQEKERGRLVDKVVFYFTDNLVSYYIINGGSSRSPGLHQLVLEIKELAAELECYLEVVHVPGTMMIGQGTDGLSRGMWLAQERREWGINQTLFEAVPYTASLGLWAATELGYQGCWPLHLHFPDVQDISVVTGRLTLWTPPPETVRQVITSYLKRWVQTPFDSCAIFLVPRILQRHWGRITRYVEERGVYQGELLPDPICFSSHLPFVVLHIPCHRPTLRENRMGKSPKASPKGWHQQQAEQVRGLS